MKSEKGETVTSRKGIANVFGESHSKPYAEERFDEEEQGPHRSQTRTKVAKRKRRKKYQSSQKMRCRLPWTASKRIH